MSTTLKKATNISLSVDVLTEARALGINISQVCDQFLRKRVRQERELRWQQEYSDFIAVYKQLLAQEELPLQNWRSF